MTFGQVLLSAFLIFIWVAWIWLVVVVLVDVFRSEDLSGWAKAGWTVLVVFFTWIGVLVYLIARGKGMNQRRYTNYVGRSQTLTSAQEDYLRSMNATKPSDGPAPAAASTAGSAEEISKLAALHDKGALTDEEFQSMKAKLLA